MESLWIQPVKNLEFDADAFEDLAWWIENDRKKALKIIKLIREVQRNPFEGTGQPESLKHDLSGCWSRRIDQEHRLVYEVLDDKIRILACRFHY
ncbi:MAG: Txe/YoeB family addiction module toxin [Pseudanabaena sp. M57BS1SP1A06MG]|uniref:Txe/YoeB family addiction module toxin n=1 Tax=Pseudanabaena mucicola TaxID=71190 RepID=UPI002578283D|nr:Txe/YoeB family addiction module toxin [Pseudanabaena mucicola]MCA6574306.1 Txe/YoeB family addiction module toxin [Pseudanabaena sp. M53BS1SP1A06MG]MCA6581438.1 Txe/YoeB family addiction module toxin [Pseudanabaena sp. M34BS1SP1A06MG]MCA6591261.1 Txe/YoeB family addiction module toxin [Pseudanabaena sp. M38BS1SP1A06MG]MCA6601727.1 Txe/YoeB family addiction module toxin [Pseudanabaena sp. M57BS1SP1A06MG]